MQTYIRIHRFSLLLLTLAIFLQGCVATQSFPNIARGGDTITLAVGSPDGMTKLNTTAQFVSDIDGSMVDLTIRSIFRLRPDQTSNVALFDSTINAQDYFTGHSQWLTVVVIDLPEGLTVGNGHIDINSAASYGALPVGVNNIPIGVEIIDGVGKRNNFTYNNNFGGVGPGYISSLEPLPQVVFKLPDAGSNNSEFAAAEIKVNVPVGDVPNYSVRIVADDFYTKNPQDQVQMSWSRNGDDFTINFISPTATMQARQLRFSIVLRASYTFLTSPAPSISSVTLFDVNGTPTELFNGVPDKGFFTIGIE